jgi:hypothetical protein
MENTEETTGLEDVSVSPRRARIGQLVVGLNGHGLFDRTRHRAKRDTSLAEVAARRPLSLV